VGQQLALLPALVAALAELTGANCRHETRNPCGAAVNIDWGRWCLVLKSSTLPAVLPKLPYQNLPALSRLCDSQSRRLLIL
jgi:hypothetical protein